MSREICRDCRRMTAQPVVSMTHVDYGVIVTDGETVCQECYGKRYDAARSAWEREHGPASEPKKRSKSRRIRNYKAGHSKAETVRRVA